MTNVKVETRPDGLVALIFDPNESHGPSSTGKTTIVATTHGAVAIGEVKVNLSVFKKA